jgi:hypothetical protein
VELEQAKDSYDKLGYNICAISYDPVSILSRFAENKHITFPLLSDTGSTVIRDFGLLVPARKANEKPDGLPYPGTFFINKNRIVTKKIMEKNYWERKSARSILASEFNRTLKDSLNGAENNHLALSWSAYPDTVFPGMRLTLGFTVALKKGMHVYAPGIKGGYKAVAVQLDSSRAFKIKSFKFPKSETIYLKAIKEKLPVYKKGFSLFQDIAIQHEKKLRKIEADLQAIMVTGTFSYQACDDKRCYLPAQIPFKLELPLRQNDWTRILN